MEVKEGKEARSRSTTFDAYAAMEAGQRLQPYQYTPKELGPHNVEIEITHCGICHTDLHLINNDFGLSAYPLVPGHEVVGIVTRAGSDVQQMLGVRVGVGWLAGNARHARFLRPAWHRSTSRTLPNDRGQPCT